MPFTAFTPEVIRENVLLPVAEIKFHAFDARADATLDKEAAQELIDQGGVKRLPRVFEDGVVYDGRTAATALSLPDAKGSKPEAIRVDIIRGHFNSLSAVKMFEIHCSSLGQNLPNKNTGYRRFATEADILHTIRKGITLTDASASDVVGLLREEGISQSRVLKLYKIARNSVDVSRLASVHQYLATHQDSTVKGAIKALGIPASFAAAVEKSAAAPRGKWTGKCSPRNFITNKQPMVNKALIASKRYANDIIALHRADARKMPGGTAINTAKAQLMTAEKIVKTWTEAVERITADVQSITPGAHRF